MRIDPGSWFELGEDILSQLKRIADALEYLMRSETGDYSTIQEMTPEGE